MDIFQHYLDLKGYTGDVITVVGTQYKEQKMHHAALFLNDTPGRSPPLLTTESSTRLLAWQLAGLVPPVGIVHTFTMECRPSLVDADGSLQYSWLCATD